MSSTKAAYSNALIYCPLSKFFLLSEQLGIIIYFSRAFKRIFFFLPPLSLSYVSSQQENLSWPSSVPTHFSLFVTKRSRVWYQFGRQPSLLVPVCIIAGLYLPAERERQCPDSYCLQLRIPTETFCISQNFFFKKTQCKVGCLPC